MENLSYVEISEMNFRNPIPGVTSAINFSSSTATWVDIYLCIHGDWNQCSTLHDGSVIGAFINDQITHGV